MFAVSRGYNGTARSGTTGLVIAMSDLTPAEVRLASSLAKGHSLVQASEQGGIKHSTARSYLESIFRKTGTHQQSELVALLKSAQP